jgi:hypothetical protein
MPIFLVLMPSKAREKTQKKTPISISIGVLAAQIELSDLLRDWQMAKKAEVFGVGVVILVQTVGGDKQQRIAQRNDIIGIVSRKIAQRAQAKWISGIKNFQTLCAIANKERSPIYTQTMRIEHRHYR